VRVHLLGGFLGAGKTTLGLSLADELRARGERVRLVTNDQGHALVDTRWCIAREEVTEITGGCFCCKFEDLATALLEAEAAGATTVIAEAVGSCTDLVATVLSPLVELHGRHLDLAPLAVVIDPWRFVEFERGRMSEDVAYLFRKQIEEADVLLPSRADLGPPDLSEPLRTLNRHAAVVPVSGLSRQGIREWLDARPARPAVPLDIDYGRYGSAEASLGWANATVRIASGGTFVPADVIRGFLDGLRDVPVAHVKVITTEPAPVRGALVREGGDALVQAEPGPQPVRESRLLVNARVALPPEQLEPRMRAALEHAAAPAHCEWETFECFRPSQPTPTHRHASRCCAPDDASCCAAFYDRPIVRSLLGDSFHPGGPALTLAVAERLALAPGARLLDVACGDGTSLRMIHERWNVDGFGIDTNAKRHSGDIDTRPGDAHELPFADGSFDAILCECALSTFVDGPRALAEMRRVLKPAGRLAITDMCVERELPSELEEWVTAGTCLLRARTGEGYRAAIEQAGLRLIDYRVDADPLIELLARIKRNLVGTLLAAVVNEPTTDTRFDVRAARAVLRHAEQAVRAGSIRYGVYVAECA